MEQLMVSIIIATYRDWHLLSKCIASLTKQSYPNESIEIIIVNNDPKDAIPEDFYLPNNCRIIEEGKPGSYAARNAGLKVIKGEIVGFTDSDCIPHEDWIKNAVEYLNKNKSCSRISGKVTVFSNSVKPSIGEKYDQIYAFPQRMYAERFHSGVTANLFTYKYVFDQIGGFDERLMSHGDLSWGAKAYLAGFTVHYVENVKVYHPARTLKELVKKEKRVGGGKGIVERGLKTKFSNFVTLVNGFRPRLAEIKFIYNANTNLKAVDKVLILLLRHYLLNVRSLEVLKVQFGKSPERC